jgi:hypothetical protein
LEPSLSLQLRSDVNKTAWSSSSNSASLNEIDIWHERYSLIILRADARYYVVSLQWRSIVAIDVRQYLSRPLPAVGNLDIYIARHKRDTFSGISRAVRPMVHVFRRYSGTGIGYVWVPLNSMVHPASAVPNFIVTGPALLNEFHM